MSSINKMQNSYTNIASIALSNNIDLKSGIIYETGNIDGTSLASSLILSVPALTDYIITDIFFSFSGTTTLTGTMVASIGTNGASYDNIMPSTTFTNWNTYGYYFKAPLSGNIYSPGPGNQVYLNVTTQFGGTVALFKILILGFEY